VLAMSHLPRSSPASRESVATKVFAEAPIKVVCGTDVITPCRFALQDVQPCHLNVVGPNGLEPLTSTVSR
jgi:hypothetical protein